MVERLRKRVARRQAPPHLMGKQNYTPLLNEAQIGQLSRDLSIPPAAVRAVLQAAGHELRERYRKRGWIASPDSGPRPANNHGKSQRKVTAIAYEQAQRAARRVVDGT
jgi:hypothetical protein